MTNIDIEWQREALLKASATLRALAGDRDRWRALATKDCEACLNPPLKRDVTMTQAPIRCTFFHWVTFESFELYDARINTPSRYGFITEQATIKGGPVYRVYKYTRGQQCVRLILKTRNKAQAQSKLARITRPEFKEYIIE